MDIQIENFLSVLNAAIHGGEPKLTEPDWNRLAELARIHSVIPLFYEGLRNVELPTELKRTLENASFIIVSTQVARTEEFLDVYGELIDGGICPRVIKGIICRETYGALCDHRPSGDEDIWIKKDEFVRCKEILLIRGFEQEDSGIADEDVDSFQEISFLNPETKLCIEVHLNLMGLENVTRAKMSRYFNTVGKSRREIVIEGQTVYTLEHTDHFMFLFLHFFKHMSNVGVGVRQIIDIMMYRRKYGDQIDWERVRAVFDEFHVEKLFSDITHIANKYLGFNFKADLPPVSPDELLSDIISAGAFGLTDRNRIVSTNIMMAAADESSGVKRVLSAIFPPAKRLVLTYPVLIKAPWLLPFVWIYRLIRYLIRNPLLGGGLGFKSYSIAQKRIKLMEKYGIKSDSEKNN